VALGKLRQRAPRHEICSLHGLASFTFDLLTYWNKSSTSSACWCISCLRARPGPGIHHKPPTSLCGHLCHRQAAKTQGAFTFIRVRVRVLVYVFLET